MESIPTLNIQSVIELLQRGDLNSLKLLNYCQNVGIWEEGVNDHILNGVDRIIDYTSKLYPLSFRSLKSPPLILFIKGNLDILKTIQDCNERYVKIGVSGSRVLDSDVSTSIRMFIASTFSKVPNAVLIAGGARGVDTLVIDLWLSRGGKVVVISPTPWNWSQTALHFLRNILCISLYPSSATIRKECFLERNVLISSLCNMLVMFKGDVRSGSMSSANYALKMDKEVYVNSRFNSFQKGYSGNQLLLNNGCFDINKLYEKLVIYPESV